MLDNLLYSKDRDCDYKLQEETIIYFEYLIMITKHRSRYRKISNLLVDQRFFEFTKNQKIKIALLFTVFFQLKITQLLMLKIFHIELLWKLIRKGFFDDLLTPRGIEILEVQICNLYYLIKRKNLKSHEYIFQKNQNSNKTIQRETLTRILNQFLKDCYSEWRNIMIWFTAYNWESCADYMWSDYEVSPALNHIINNKYKKVQFMEDLGYIFLQNADFLQKADISKKFSIETTTDLKSVFQNQFFYDISDLDFVLKKLRIIDING